MTGAEVELLSAVKTKRKKMTFQKVTNFLRNQLMCCWPSQPQIEVEVEVVMPDPDPDEYPVEYPLLTTTGPITPIKKAVIAYLRLAELDQMFNFENRCKKPILTVVDENSSNLDDIILGEDEDFEFENLMLVFDDDDERGGPISSGNP